MFRFKGFGVGFWRDLLRRVEELNGDLCLVGSYARGDASSMSDVDLSFSLRANRNLSGRKYSA